MILGLSMCLGHFLPIRTVFTLLLTVRYLLQLRLRLCPCVWLGLCLPELSLIYSSNLILDLIHSEIVAIDLLPLFSQLICLTGLNGSLGDNHHCDVWSHHNDDDIEVIFCYEYRQQVGTGNDEVKSENAQPDTVSTTIFSSSLISLTIYFGQDDA